MTTKGRTQETEPERPSGGDRGIIREHLAEHRTSLANKRTFLAYLRTGLTFFGAGLAIIKFFGHPIVQLLGWLMLPAGLIIFVWGFVIYRKMNKLIQSSLILALAFISTFSSSPLYSGQENPHLLVHDFPIPKEVSLCGESMPLDNLHVREMLDRELTIAVWDHAQVFMWLKRAGRYFPLIEKRLAAEGMPQDLKYLAVAESSLLTHIKSNAGAYGPWQFITHTARLRGLRKDRTIDERLHFEKATDAALSYLYHLKGVFGTWTLALAAYNCGEARLKEELQEQRVNDYYRLNLPLETERFVFRIASAKIIMENPKRYGYNLKPDQTYAPIECDTVPVKIKARLHITDFARALGTDYKIIKELNPFILGYYLPLGHYRIKVPPGIGPQVAPTLKRLARTAPARKRKASSLSYVVQPGDTLTQISRKTGVSLSTLKRLNRIQGSMIKVGQRLRLAP